MKMSQLDKAIAKLKAEREVLHLAILKLEQQKCDSDKPKRPKAVRLESA